MDPKEVWARAHPEFFPVRVNADEPRRLLRVPGLGAVAVARILAFRRAGARISSLADLGRQSRTLRKAEPYLAFS